MTDTGSERRTERRSPASGGVKITLVVAPGESFDGELLDVSSAGFRIAHTQAGLERGSEVRFEHPEASGTALVVWNRFHAGQSETGFLVLDG